MRAPLRAAAAPLWLLLSAGPFLACSEEPPAATPPIAACVDADADGIDSCADCDDHDSSMKPGAVEVCGDGKDNDCDGTVDDGCGTGTPDAGGPKPDAGGGCPGVDTTKDVSNCGQCGKVCPAPKNATARCEAGVCGRGPCATGFFDLDGAATFGCEATCADKRCVDGAGKTVTFTSALLPETGDVFHAFSSSSSFGGGVQTNGKHTNTGIVGEPTPPGVGGAVVQGNSTHKNIGGFTAIERRK